MTESSINKPKERIAVEYGKKNPFPAEVKHMVNLNGRGSAKETYHVELSLAGSGLSYGTGDVAGILPTNCPEVVQDFMTVAGLDGEEMVPGTSGSERLSDVLAKNFSVTLVNLPLMKKYAGIANNVALNAFIESDDKERIKQWLWGREMRDLIAEFPPSSPLESESLLGILRKMPPRLYSIASSLKAHPDEVHLTVGAVEWDSHGRHRKGVCSTYLCQRIQPGDEVLTYTHHNKNFGLPDDDDVPVIMIGPGTGIAPFRAFLEERQQTGAKGKNWLFFGDQHFATDFLYQLEWQKFMKKGILTRMDVAFSRDQDYKIYVQDRVKEKAADIYAWLQEGAYFYVCGDANRMAKDVHQALIDIYVEQGGLSTDAAEEAVNQLKKDKRYQRDVY